MKTSKENITKYLYLFRGLYCQNVDLITIDEFIEETAKDLIVLTQEQAKEMIGNAIDATYIFNLKKSIRNKQKEEYINQLFNEK